MLRVLICANKERTSRMPNDNDLIERYLYAITRRLPAKQRADVAEELRTLISDMLDERCGNLPPTAKDVRVVLTELGTPGEVVRKYTADEDACLIGQPYYAQYLYVLKIVLACVAGGMLVAGALSLATGAERGVLGSVLEAVGSLIAALVFAFAFVTLLFAFFSRRGVDVEVMGSLDDLPPVPRESKNPARGDAVAGIVFSIVGAIVFLLFPDVLNALSHRGDGVPFDPFNTEAIRSSAWVIIAWTVVCIGAESFKLVEGRYTPRLLVVTLASDLVVAALAVFWLTNFQLVDSQAILQAMQASGDAPSGPILWAVSNAQTAFCGFIVIALAIDAVDSIVKTVKASR